MTSVSSSSSFDGKERKRNCSRGNPMEKKFSLKILDRVLPK